MVLADGRSRKAPPIRRHVSRFFASLPTYAIPIARILPHSVVDQLSI
tara:strand:+ start:4056 stop:4196 length:141 start_codon:yes stop_codon:yes gene_type:complete